MQILKNIDLYKSKKYEVTAANLSQTVCTHFSIDP